MDYAIERWTNRGVTASQAARSRYRRDYLCPVCKKKVVLRSGRKMRDHFAHSPGVVGTAECELYHPASGDFHAGPQTARVAPLPLYLRVSGLIRRRAGWLLEVLLPQTTIGTGHIVVDSVAGQQSVRCRDLINRRQRVSVPIGSTPYRLRPSHDVEPQLARRARLPVPALHSEQPTAFRYTHTGGRRLTEGKPLHWGRGYYFVWPASSELVWPEPIWLEELGTQKGWRCVRVELPGDQDDAVEQWIGTVLGRSVEHPPLRLALVSPPVLDYSGQTRGIPAGVPVVIAVLRDHGAGIPLHVSVWPSDEALQQTIALPGGTDAWLVRISGITEVLHVGLTATDSEADEMADEMVLQVLDEQMPAWPAETQIHVRRDGRTECAPAFADKVDQLLKHVSFNTATLRGVTLPAGAGWAVRLRQAQHLPWQTQSIWKPEDIGEAAAVDLDHPASIEWVAAVERARQLGGEIYLDFGAFGTPSLFCSPEPRNDSIQVPDSLIAQLRGLASLPYEPARSRVPGFGEVQGLRVLRDRLAPDASDGVRAVLEAVLQRHAWPATALPRLRQTEADARRLIRGGPTDS
jgi:hypothetical protein